MEYLTTAITLEPAYKVRARTDGAFDFMKNITEFRSLIEENAKN
jgi:hypothetical protein